MLLDSSQSLIKAIPPDDYNETYPWDIWLRLLKCPSLCHPQATEESDSLACIRTPSRVLCLSMDLQAGRWWWFGRLDPLEMIYDRWGCDHDKDIGISGPSSLIASLSPWSEETLLLHTPAKVYHTETEVKQRGPWPSEHAPSLQNQESKWTFTSLKYNKMCILLQW